MADLLKVDPVALHLGSSDMFNAVGEAALPSSAMRTGWPRPSRAGSEPRSER